MVGGCLLQRRGPSTGCLHGRPQEDERCAGSAICHRFSFKKPHGLTWPSAGLVDAYSSWPRAPGGREVAPLLQQTQPTRCSNSEIPSGFMRHWRVSLLVV
jgi:hypothetical protein